MTEELDELRAEVGLYASYLRTAAVCGWRGNGEATEEAAHRELASHIEACPKMRERENAAVVRELHRQVADLNDVIAKHEATRRMLAGVDGGRWDSRIDELLSVRHGVQRRIAELTPKPEGETP